MSNGRGPRTVLYDTDGDNPLIGQQARSGSIPVTIASDQTVLSVTGSVGLSGPITGSVGLSGPVAVSNLAAWLGSTAPTVGQKAMSASLPVVMASDQAPIAVTFNTPNARTGVSAGKLLLGGTTAGNLFEVRATAYNEPATAAQRSFASSNAADAAAGTGARTVKVTYFDNSGNGPLTETVTLNGTTAVATVATNIRFIQEIEVKTAGSSKFNVGTISLFVNNSGGGGTIASIGIGNIVAGVGDNHTLYAHHYVPAGWTTHFSVLICGIASGGSGTNGQFFLRTLSPLVTSSADQLVGDLVLAIGAFERSFTFTPEIDGFAFVHALCVPGTNNSTVTCAFDWTESPT